jgi:DNA-binding ferritin-like protein
MIVSFLTILNQLHVFHWQTTSYAQHKAFGKAYETLTDLFDRFIETYYGKYGRPSKRHEYMIESYSYINFNTDEEMMNYLISIFDKTQDNINSLLVSDTDSDLININEEIKAEFNHVKYLLSLK